MSAGYWTEVLLCPLLLENKHMVRATTGSTSVHSCSTTVVCLIQPSLRDMFRRSCRTSTYKPLSKRPSASSCQCITVTSASRANRRHVFEVPRARLWNPRTARRHKY
ncbi:hypothetical protein EV363DRAFT_1348447 [Boletus edulis]|uniref:Uncharacterized protein n=1 Tax=Boletus edulis BED1 TaxID=1328754 RepID=A0AAD4BU37_BOLED|nr:hypothetical protein EV363DRAFT_1348447 [Boletus edulis]KAF8439771.1 hypothetical protein L210DRAFT_3540288 [Boletus edulis BED1]